MNRVRHLHAVPPAPPPPVDMEAQRRKWLTKREPLPDTVTYACGAIWKRNPEHAQRAREAVAMRQGEE